MVVGGATAIWRLRGEAEDKSQQAKAGGEKMWTELGSLAASEPWTIFLLTGGFLRVESIHSACGL